MFELFYIEILKNNFVGLKFVSWKKNILTYGVEPEFDVATVSCVGNRAEQISNSPRAGSSG